ncbi:MAG: hypothetical protein ACO1Q7_01285 [Gemmatimonas sp.]
MKKSLAVAALSLALSAPVAANAQPTPGNCTNALNMTSFVGYLDC